MHKYEARTLLIGSSMLRLKELEYKYFELGGGDDINTEDVAKYKQDVGGTDMLVQKQWLETRMITWLRRK